MSYSYDLHDQKSKYALLNYIFKYFVRILNFNDEKYLHFM